jgi:hypothetical protein
MRRPSIRVDLEIWEMARWNRKKGEGLDTDS